MAASIVAVNNYEGTDFDETGNVSVTLNGSGSDRSVIVIAIAQAGGASNAMGTMQLNSTNSDYEAYDTCYEPTEPQQSCTIAVQVWNGTSEPGTGTFNLTPAWVGIGYHHFWVIEVQDSEQTASSLISGLQSTTAADLAYNTPTDYEVTLTSQTGKLGIVCAGLADASYISTSDPTADDANTNLDSGPTLDTAVSASAQCRSFIGYDNSIANASEDFGFGITHNRSATAVDAVHLIAFAVEGVAASSTIPIFSHHYTKNLA